MLESILKTLKPLIEILPKWALVLLAIIVLTAITARYLTEAMDKFLAVLERIHNRGFVLIKSENERARIKRRTLFLSVIRRDIEALSKKESWDDQAFADIDAEVEIEGNFFATRIARIFGKTSKGVRKVQSVMYAISSSTNNNIVVLGEAGSGKSVALRHLAIDLARRAERSGSKEVIIPLYVNLREFDADHYKNIDCESIRKFVLDNVRRDSPSTVEYVVQNWDRCCESGSWCFIFDSFDEIPAVLHAADPQAVRERYVGALCSFLYKTGECKSVVASRDFKGPDVDEWGKVRILPLSRKRQHELVSKSLIAPKEKKQIAKYLSEYEGLLYRNPLFLTLLCKYVGITHSLPTTEHDLLQNHISTLIKRDSDYISRIFKMSVDEIQRFSLSIASLYALNTRFGLSPSKNEILAELDQESALAKKIDDILGALTACKVMRKDVGEGGSSEARFSFSHRRYQETLFVQYAISSDGNKYTKKITEDLQLREYLVTLLQGQSDSVVEVYLREVERHTLNAIKNAKIEAPIDFPSTRYGYIDWRTAKHTYYLSVLREGLRGRYKLLSTDFKTNLQLFLSQRLNEGDITDLYMVVRFCGLCSDEFAQMVLGKAVDSHSTMLKLEAFQQVGYIGIRNDSFAEHFRKRFSSQVLLANTPTARLKVEAMLDRVDSSTGCSLVYKRACILRFFFGWAIRMVITVENTASHRFQWLSQIIRALIGTPERTIPITCWAFLSIPVSAILSMGNPTGNFAWGMFLSGSTIALLIFAFIAYKFRSEPRAIDWNIVTRRTWRWICELPKSGDFKLLLITAACVAFFIVLLRVIASSSGYNIPLIISIALASSVFMVFILTLGYILRKHENSEDQKAVASLTKGKTPLLTALFSVKEYHNFTSWCMILMEREKITEQEARSIFCILACAERGSIPERYNKKPVFSTIRISEVYRRTGAVLLDIYLLGRLKKESGTSTTSSSK